MRGSDNHKRVEFASRKNAGIRVTLLWAADTNAVAVLVRDGSTGDEFELLVEPEENPIHVYYHPYAYTAWRGIDYLEAIDLFRSLCECSPAAGSSHRDKRADAEAGRTHLSEGVNR